MVNPKIKLLALALHCQWGKKHSKHRSGLVNDNKLAGAESHTKVDFQSKARCLWILITPSNSMSKNYQLRRRLSELRKLPNSNTSDQAKHTKEVTRNWSQSHKRQERGTRHLPVAVCKLFKKVWWMLAIKKSGVEVKNWRAEARKCKINNLPRKTVKKYEKPKITVKNRYV